MTSRDLIVVGASAGGVDALQRLVSGFGDELQASVCIVLHCPPTGPNLLPQILRQRTTLKVVQPETWMELEKRTIYVSQPDQHLFIEDRRVGMSRGPKENRSRPAVDVLFRSAAFSHGTRVIGVVLTGDLDDGTAGLWGIKHRGGLAVVQDPDDAAHRSMPESALRHVAVDHVSTVAQMSSLLTRLTQTAPLGGSKAMSKEMKIEAQIGRGIGALQLGIMDLGPVSPFTCPECRGVLVALREGTGMPRFRCHTGHAYSPASLLSELTEKIEDSFWDTIRRIEESVMLLSNSAKYFLEKNDPERAQHYERKARDAQHRANLVREVLQKHEVIG